jgi:hypothetical protein
MVRDDLIFLNEDQLKDSFLNKRVRVVLNDDQEETFIVKRLSVTPYAFNGSCSVFGFISQSGKSYSFLGIKEIYVLTT